jgi:hypothetical protein
MCSNGKAPLSTYTHIWSAIHDVHTHCYPDCGLHQVRILRSIQQYCYKTCSTLELTYMIVHGVGFFPTKNCISLYLIWFNHLISICVLIFDIVIFSWYQQNIGFPSYSHTHIMSVYYPLIFIAITLDSYPA